MAVPDPQPEEPADRPDAPGRRPLAQPGVLPSFAVIGLFLAVALLLYFGLPTLGADILANVVRILITLFAGLLPATIYSYFIQGRLPILFTEYKQNLRRLGFPENAPLYRDKFEAVYGAEARPDREVPLFQSPIIITTLLSLLGWVLVFYPAAPGSTLLTPRPEPEVYAFLGAYVFGMGMLIRQYVIDDLQPRYYASLTSRYLIVFVLSWLVALVTPAPGSAPLPLPSYLAAAFVIGLFPSVGVRVAERAGTAILGRFSERFREDQPLSDLDGLNAYQEDRLLLEGIESLQNLSCAKIVDLMLKTRYPVEQLVDWMDQALLHLHARERVKEFQQHGLRTATDFLDAYNPPGAAQPEPARQALAKLLAGGAESDTTLALLDNLASALRLDPNMFHIRYWRDHVYEALPEDVDRSRTTANLKLMQGYPDEAIAVYNELVREYPNDHTTRLYRGLAFFALRQYSRAIDDYTQAIERGGVRWEGARQAYVERGRAWRELAEYTRAAENYQEALRLFPDFPEALLELAFVQMTHLGLYAEAIEHLQILVQAKFKEAESLANLGLARYERWKKSGGSEPEGQTELTRARADLERAMRLKPDLIAPYLTQANVLEDLGLGDDALQTLTQALTVLETLRDPANAYRARLQRGNLYLARGDYAAAVSDYSLATRLAPDNVAAFYNLGVALQRNRQPEPARQAFRDAVRLNAKHIPASQALGEVSTALGLTDEAETALSQALRLARESADRRGQALAHLGLGQLYRALANRAPDASRELHQARQLADDLDDLTYTRASYELGLVELAAQNLSPAISLFTASAELFDVLGEPRASAEAHYQLGRAYLQQASRAAAAEALREARQQLADIFQPQDPADLQLQQQIDAALAEAGGPGPAQPSAP